MIYTGFWTLWLIVFAVMFVLLTVAVVGIPSGIMMSGLGLIILLFKADFVITELAPEIMLFGGAAAAFFSAFLGALAVKLGFRISHLFVRIRKRNEEPY